MRPPSSCSLLAMRRRRRTSSSSSESFSLIRQAGPTDVSPLPLATATATAPALPCPALPCPAPTTSYITRIWKGKEWPARKKGEKINRRTEREGGGVGPRRFANTDGFNGPLSVRPRWAGLRRRKKKKERKGEQMLAVLEWGRGGGGREKRKTG